ncbi:SDR family oxidoreductase [Bacillus marinisedimentorum]|uniref:SDR family oxidoreductase n=1 Tax=Bacillus marinisedimentorum TaxID=1821260 RepID=UPI0008728AD9|nr:SDR family oxidoreductase [Bacillus marinisedimentorum]
MGSLDGQVVVITGASSGIGEATAEKLAGEGAKVMLAARREERLKEIADQIRTKGGGEIDFKTTDVTSRQDVEELIAYTKETFGPVDVLFNNAGLMPLSLMDKVKVEEWERMVDVNIKGVLYGIAAVLPDMKERNTGHIITTSSVAGHEIFPGSAVYSGTKFAVRVVMEGLNKELARTNIKSTSISPGAVATELTQTITDEDILSGFAKQQMTPLQSEDIANAVYYAISQPEGVEVNEVIVRPTSQG